MKRTMPKGSKWTIKQIEDAGAVPGEAIRARMDEIYALLSPNWSLPPNADWERVEQKLDYFVRHSKDPRNSKEDYPPADILLMREWLALLHYS